MSTRSGQRPAGSAPALAAGLALLAAVLLTGCADRATPVSDTSPTASSASGPTPSAASGAASGASNGSVGVDPKAAGSIEDSVDQAESLLKELDQDFQGDAADVG